MSLRYRLDPAALFEDVVGDPDPWQVSALRSPSKRQLYLASRQSGKSSVAAIKSLWTAMYLPGSLTLLVSPSLPQSQEIFRKCLSAYRALGRQQGIERESALRVEFSNKSRIISLPGSEKTNVGYSANLVVLDEASRTPSELVEAVLPTTAVTGGTTIVLSTPRGARGWFFDLWHSPGVEETWQTFRVTADDCPRIDKEAIEAERLMRGSRHVAQEYYCSFEADDEAFFDPAAVDRMLTLRDLSKPPRFPESCHPGLGQPEQGALESRDQR